MNVGSCAVVMEVNFTSSFKDPFSHALLHVAFKQKHPPHSPIIVITHHQILFQKRLYMYIHIFLKPSCLRTYSLDNTVETR